MFALPFLLLSLSASALGSLTGLINPIFTISIGYGASMTIQAVAAYLLNRSHMDSFGTAHVVLVGLYGLRLAGFLLWRDSLQSFASRRDGIRRRAASLPTSQVFTMIIGCIVLYSAMFMPAAISMRPNLPTSGWKFDVSAVGLVISALALLWEATADITQQLYYERGGSSPCAVGPWKWMRHPNYVGEVIFWQAGWLAALRGHRSVMEGLLAALGVIGITGIIWLEGNRNKPRKVNDE